MEISKNRQADFCVKGLLEKLNKNKDLALPLRARNGPDLHSAAKAAEALTGASGAEAEYLRE